jgi:hypothetical protein
MLQDFKSDMCRSTTQGWECLVWGESCNIMCGNGLINDMDALNSQTAQTRTSYLTYDGSSSTETDIFKYVEGVQSALVYDADTNNISDFQEECDMGIFNIDPSTITDGTSYLYPCTH